MKKNYLLTILLLSTMLILSACGNKNTNKETNTNNTTNEQAEEQPLTPEEVLARMDAEEGVGIEQGIIEVSIVSPEGDTFSQGQARHYQATISNIVNGSSCSCDWKFYLNEYDEETLFQQMDDRTCSGTDTKGQLECGFTSSFINSRGDLRVHVDVEVKKDGEIVQSASAERNYKVE